MCTVVAQIREKAKNIGRKERLNNGRINALIEMAEHLQAKQNLTMLESMDLLGIEGEDKDQYLLRIENESKI